jgi:hypothetical protein
VNHPLPRLALLIGGIGGGFIVLVHQALGWFRTDVWTAVSVLTGLQWLQIRWAVLPQEWHGLHQFLGHLPLAIALPVVGLLGALALRSRS